VIRYFLIATTFGIMLVGCKGAEPTAAPTGAPGNANIRETYEESCSVPPDSWKQRTGEIRERRTHYLVTLEHDGRMTWTGTQISVSDLRHNMQSVDARVGVDVRFIAAPSADCRQVRVIRSVMNQFPICYARADCIEGTVGMPPPPDQAL
jgi:hypothetical protein